MQFKDNNASKTSVHHDLIQANNEVLSNEVMLDSSNNLDNDFFASVAGDKELIQVNNEIKALETELILNGSIAGIAGNDLLLSSEISQDKANNKALNANNVIIDF